MLALRTPRATVTTRALGRGRRARARGRRPPPTGPARARAGRRARASSSTPSRSATAGDGRFAVACRPRASPRWPGRCRCARTTWELRVRPRRRRRRGPGHARRRALRRLPVATVVDHKPFAARDVARRRAPCCSSAATSTTTSAAAASSAGCARRSTRPAAREPLRDAVVYTSFGGRQYSDNPRAIHEELVRRGLPLEHLWVVQGRHVPRARRPRRSCAPAAASTTRRWPARASSSPTTTSPSGSSAAPDQVCLQTWHGTPLKQLGFDVSRPAQRRPPLRARLGAATCSTGSTSSPPTASRRRSCGAPTRSRARCSRPATRATTCSRGADRDARGARGPRGGSACPADARVVLYAPDLPRRRPRQPRPLPPRAGARHRPAARGRRRRHGDPVPQAPLLRRPRARDRRRVRARRLGLSRRRPS